jgi:hypothetical protein
LRWWYPLCNRISYESQDPWWEGAAIHFASSALHSDAQRECLTEAVLRLSNGGPGVAVGHCLALLWLYARCAMWGPQASVFVRNPGMNAHAAYLIRG